MARGGREGGFASQSSAVRAFVPPAGVTTGCVGTACKAAAGRKKRSTKRPVHRKGRPSREGWRAVPYTPPLKGRVRGEVLTPFSASMCRNGTFFLGTPLFAFFLLAENKAGIKFICYTNFGPKMIPLLNIGIFKNPRNPSLITRTLRFAKIDWTDLPFLLVIFTVKNIFIILHKKIPIIVLFAVRL